MGEGDFFRGSQLLRFSVYFLQLRYGELDTIYRRVQTRSKGNRSVAESDGTTFG